MYVCVYVRMYVCYVYIYMKKYIDELYICIHVHKIHMGGAYLAPSWPENLPKIHQDPIKKVFKNSIDF